MIYSEYHTDNKVESFDISHYVTS